MNSPEVFAPIAVLLLLGSVGVSGLFLLAAFWYRRRAPERALRYGLGAGVVVAGYLLVLVGNGMLSREGHGRVFLALPTPAVQGS